MRRAIRHIRKQNGYTQEQLAEEPNMDRSVLSRIEAGTGIGKTRLPGGRDGVQPFPDRGAGRIPSPAVRCTDRRRHDRPAPPGGDPQREVPLRLRYAAGVRHEILPYFSPLDEDKLHRAILEATNGLDQTGQEITDV